MHYEKAPVAEAIIDLRVVWPTSSPNDAFKGLTARFAETLPVAKAIRTLEMTAHIPEDERSAQFTQSDTVVGVRLDKSDKSRVAQFQRGGFTYSHLPPYTNWETFKQEAGPLWEAYREATGVERVIRTAVRYINRFRVPARLSESSDYVKCFPAVPESLIGETAKFGLQVVRKLLIAPDSTALITCGATEVEGSVTEFLLDFDVSINAEVDASSSVPWEWLSLLRDSKNKLFEELITPRARTLFEESHVA